MKNVSSFTLLELAIVVIIAGIIASLGYVNYMDVLWKMKSQEGVETLLNIYRAQKVYKLEHGAYATQLDQLELEIRPMQHFQDLIILNGGNYWCMAIDGVGRPALAQIRSRDGFGPLHHLSQATVIQHRGRMIQGNNHKLSSIELDFSRFPVELGNSRDGRHFFGIHPGQNKFCRKIA